MFSAVVFCPHPPMLIPEIAQGAAHELEELRSACRAAIRKAFTPDLRLLVLGHGPATMGFPATARGSLAAHGVPLEVPLGSDEPGPVELPLSLTIGAWLLRETLGPNCGAVGQSVGPNDAELPALGDDAPWALLVMGDGSARRGDTAPGYLDPRAEPFDRGLATALRSGRREALLTDIALGDELLATAPRVWNAAQAQLPDDDFDADLLYDEAPYGVGYFVASWTRRG